MTVQEKTLADLQDTIQQGLTVASGGVAANQIEVRAKLSDMKATLTKLTGLSRLDTYNRSAAMSLAESTVANDVSVMSEEDEPD